MFFEMYEEQGEQVAEIIKDAALGGERSGKDVENAEDSSQAIRTKVQALKRKGTLRRDQLDELGPSPAQGATIQTTTAINTADEDYQNASSLA